MQIREKAKAQGLEISKSKERVRAYRERQIGTTMVERNIGFETKNGKRKHIGKTFKKRMIFKTNNFYYMCVF